MVYLGIQSKAAKNLIQNEPQTLPRHLKSVTNIQVEESVATVSSFCGYCWVSQHLFMHRSSESFSQHSDGKHLFFGQSVGMERKIWLLPLL